MVSIASIILLITKRYSIGFGTTYKRFSRFRDIIALKLPKVTKEITGFY